MNIYFQLQYKLLIMNLIRIKSICETKGVSIRNIAEQIGMSEQNIHRCIRVNQIQAHQLEIIAKFFNVPIGYFFDDDKSVPPNTASVKGNNNVLVGGNNNGSINKLANCEREVEHLNAIVEEKERLIQVLMKNQPNK